MAKKKNNKKTDKSVNAVIIACTVAILILIACIAGLSIYKTADKAPDNNETTEYAMMTKINELGITENPVATLEMADGGIIKIELYPKTAPNTVCNFIELANSGYYDGLIFHRCIQDFMIQGGCPEGTGTGGPGYTIFGEFTNNGFTNNLSHERGVVSMARQQMPLDSAGSQFFITVADSTFLDGDYAAFGKVIEGMDVADAIVAIETDASDKPVVDQVIKSIRVDTKGIKYPEAEKIQ